MAAMTMAAANMLPNNSMNFTENQHGHAVLETLHHQREQNLFCDVILHVQGQQFEAHRCVLAACSKYFQSVFKQERVVKEQLTISCGGHEIFKCLLDYIYTGNVVIDKHNVCELVRLSNHFSVLKLRGHCSEYLERYLDVTNCLSVLDMAGRYQMAELLRTAAAFVRHNIDEVLRQQEAMELPHAKVETIITDKDLDLSPERQLSFILDWVRHAVTSRESELRQLLLSVPLQLLERGPLQQLLGAHRLLAESERCLYATLQSLADAGVRLPAYEHLYSQIEEKYMQDLVVDNEALMSMAINTAIEELEGTEATIFDGLHRLQQQAAVSGQNASIEMFSLAGIEDALGGGGEAAPAAEQETARDLRCHGATEPRHSGRYQDLVPLPARYQEYPDPAAEQLTSQTGVSASAVGHDKYPDLTAEGAELRYGGSEHTRAAQRSAARYRTVGDCHEMAGAYGGGGTLAPVVSGASVSVGDTQYLMVLKRQDTGECDRLAPASDSDDRRLEPGQALGLQCVVPWYAEGAVVTTSGSGGEAGYCEQPAALAQCRFESQRRLGDPGGGSADSVQADSRYPLSRQGREPPTSYVQTGDTRAAYDAYACEPALDPMVSAPAAEQTTGLLYTITTDSRRLDNGKLEQQQLQVRFDEHQVRFGDQDRFDEQARFEEQARLEEQARFVDQARVVNQARFAEEQTRVAEEEARFAVQERIAQDQDRFLEEQGRLEVQNRLVDEHGKFGELVQARFVETDQCRYAVDTAQDRFAELDQTRQQIEQSRFEQLEQARFEQAELARFEQTDQQRSEEEAAQVFVDQHNQLVEQHDQLRFEEPSPAPAPPPPPPPPPPPMPMPAKKRKLDPGLAEELRTIHEQELRALHDREAQQQQQPPAPLQLSPAPVPEPPQEPYVPEPELRPAPQEDELRTTLSEPPTAVEERAPRPPSPAAATSAAAAAAAVPTSAAAAPAKDSTMLNVNLSPKKKRIRRQMEMTKQQEQQQQEKEQQQQLAAAAVAAAAAAEVAAAADRAELSPVPTTPTTDFTPLLAVPPQPPSPPPPPPPAAPKKRPGKARTGHHPCRRCQSVFAVRSALYKHMHEVHRDVGKKTFMCNICEMTCDKKALYSRHMMTHFTGPPYSCSICFRDFMNFTRFLMHRREHGENKPHRCNECNLSFWKKCNLEYHLRVHTGEKPFSCGVCGDRFSQMTSLKQHMYRHQEGKNLFCDECDFSTKYANHLLTHKKIHNGDLHRCSHTGCNYTTPKRSHLREHLQSHAKRRNHHCPHCQRTFNVKTHLSRHMRSHDTSKLLQCDVCGYTSYRGDRMKAHMEIHSRPPPKTRRGKVKKSKKIIHPETDPVPEPEPGPEPEPEPEPGTEPEPGLGPAEPMSVPEPPEPQPEVEIQLRVGDAPIVADWDVF